MDKIFLHQLAAPVMIGIYDHEKALPQIIYLDVEAAVDAAKAAASDNIGSTLDYAAIYHFLRDYIAATRFQLLETLAEKISEELIKTFSIRWLRLTITKKPSDLPGITGAGVVIERTSQI